MKANTLTLALLAGVLGVAAVTPDTEARDRKRSGSYATGAGKSGTYERHVDRSRGSVKRRGSITTQNGKTYSRSSNSNYDRNTGAVDRSVTGVRGNTRTVTGTYDKGTQTYDRTITGAQGRQTHATTVYDRDAKSASSTYTGPKGKTATGTTTYNAQNKGFDTTVTGPDGNTHTRSSSNVYDKESGTLTRSVTGFGGDTRTVEITPDRTQ